MFGATRETATTTGKIVLEWIDGNLGCLEQNE